ncbi:MAG: FHA domain-containing protein [Proteobacteria bacterium]|nr:FHA domain-containing protein [Pseudomonadota bacterium]
MITLRIIKRGDDRDQKRGDDRDQAPKTKHFSSSEITIGRSRGNDLVLDSSSVSSRHALLTLHEGKYFLVDLGSQNGTYVNQAPVEFQTVVANRDEIAIGDFLLQLEHRFDDDLRTTEYSGHRRPQSIAGPIPPTGIMVRPQWEESIDRWAQSEPAAAALQDDERDLLQMIHDNPDQIEPRLVYADWLRERGDPRGEFIALQCANAREGASPGAGGVAPGSQSRVAQLCELADAHGASWLRPFLGESRYGFSFTPAGEGRVWIDGAPDGSAFSLKLERGFFVCPLCISPPDNALERDRLFRLSPTLYEVERPIGSGPFTAMYRAHQYSPRGGGPAVAVKCSSRAVHGAALPASVEPDPAGKLIEHEETIANLAPHPNIVRNFGLAYFGLTGYQALIMEWLEGYDLGLLLEQARLRGRPISPPLAAGIASRLCLALHRLHTVHDPNGQKARIIHRQVRPNHVMVTRNGHVKLLDFAWAAADSAAISRPEDIVEQLYPASPELSSSAGNGLSPEEYWRQSHLAHDALVYADGAPRGDVFSCGVLLYELLCQQHPFWQSGMSTAEVKRSIEMASYPAPSKLVKVPHEVEIVALRAMLWNRGEQYPSALDMHRDLEAALAAHGWSSEPDALAELLQPLH